MENLAFNSLLRWKVILLPILPTSLIHFLSNRLGECTFWSQDWKGYMYSISDNQAAGEIWNYIYTIV